MHLTRRTLGDLALEREVLGLMQRQILAFTDRLALATGDERRQIAHALKGSARNIGAFSLAAAADALEAAPESQPARATLEAEMRRASVFIRSIGG